MIRNPGRFTITVIVIVNIIVLTIVVTRFLALSTKVNLRIRNFIIKNITDRVMTIFIIFRDDAFNQFKFCTKKSV